MKIIGLTGGIGTGKSTVSNYLKELGYEIIDADLMSHEIMNIDSEAYMKIVSNFGKNVLEPNGEINRKKLATLVFSDKEKLKQLEEITTKQIAKDALSVIEKLRNQGKEGMAFFDAPLLLENNFQKYCDKVWVVVADRALRISRVEARDNDTPLNIEKRMDNQLSDHERVILADCVINNSGSLNELYEQIDALLREEYEKH